MSFPDYPRGFRALLVNPLVGEVARLDELVDVMLERQKAWLGCIR